METLQPPHAGIVEPPQLLAESFPVSKCSPGVCVGLLAWDRARDRGTVREDEPVYGRAASCGFKAATWSCHVLPTSEDLLIFRLRFRSVTRSTALQSSESVEGCDSNRSSSQKEKQ